MVERLTRGIESNEVRIIQKLGLRAFVGEFGVFWQALLAKHHHSIIELRSSDK